MTTTIIPAHLNSDGMLVSSWACGKIMAEALNKVESIYKVVSYKNEEHTIHIYSKRKSHGTKPWLEEFEIVVKSDQNFDEDTLLAAAEKAAKEELKEIEVKPKPASGSGNANTSAAMLLTKEQRKRAELNIFSMLFPAA